MTLFARFVSYLFHPVLFFLIMPFFIVYRQTDSGLYAMKWMIFSSVFIFIGVMLILFETLRGDFSDVDISKKEQRQKFFLILLVLGAIYLAASLFFKGIFFPLSFISLSILLGILIFTLLNGYVKASIHVAVACGFVLSMKILFGESVLLVTLWLVPLIAWARLYLKKHTVTEVISGGVAGTCITVFTFIIGKYLLYNKGIW